MRTSHKAALAVAATLGMSSVGLAVTGTSALANTLACNRIDVGQLCANFVDGNKGYDAQLTVDANQPRNTVQFRLKCATKFYWDDGPFIATQGSHTFFFAKGNQGSCLVQLIVSESNQLFQSPAVP